MAQKKRTGITSSINSNIYDNGNKEIFAAMVREVLDDVKDSYFNLLDDQLANMKFNNENTLQEYFNKVTGRVPLRGTVENFDVGSTNTGQDTGGFDVDGIISSAYTVKVTRDDHLIEINFSKSIGNRFLIPVIRSTAGSYWDDQNDIATPVIIIISTTKIKVAIREISNPTQNISLDIIAI